MKKRTIFACVVVFLLLRGLASAGYTDNGNGTVTDTITNLMWQTQDDATGRTWEQALTYCEGLSLGSHTDWRLPNIKELTSLVDTTRNNPAIDPLFLSTQSSVQSSNYWSSTTFVGSTTNAWYVMFFDGQVRGGGKASTYYVRCVR